MNSQEVMLKLWLKINQEFVQKPFSRGIKIKNIQEIKSKLNHMVLIYRLEKELGIKDNDVINNFMENLKEQKFTKLN